MSNWAVRIVKLLLLVGLVSVQSESISAEQADREIFPPVNGKGAIVVVVSGNSGPELYRDYSANLAGLGYYAVLVSGRDVLIRAGDDQTKDGKAFLKKIIADAQSALAALPGKVALVGFSRGGAGVLKHGSSMNSVVSAVVAYYPSITLLGDAAVADIAAKVKTPVLLIAAGSDSYCLVETAEALRKDANSAGATVELIVYQSASHGFNLQFGSFRADDASDAWNKSSSFLKRNHPPTRQ